MKFSKKILSVIIAVLMVVSSMPFTAFTAYAADIDDVKSAMKAFEDYMKTGNVYTNMKTAYNAYVEANNAINAACKGDPSKLAAAATALTSATDSMSVTKLTTPTTVTPQFENGDVASDYYGNVLYSNGTGDQDFTEFFSGGRGSSGSAGEVKAKYHTNTEIVLLYSGSGTTAFPITTEIYMKKSTGVFGRKDLFLKAICSYVTSDNSIWKVDKDWIGQNTTWNYWPSSNLANMLSREPEQSDWDNKGGINTLYKNVNETFIFGTRVVYQGSGNTTTYYDVFNSTNNIEFLLYLNGGVGEYIDYKKNINVLGNENIYVLNYAPVPTAFNAKKELLKNVANYKQGGLSSVIDALNSALTLNVNSYFTSENNVANAAKAIKNVVENLDKATVTEDSAQTVNHAESSVPSWTTTKNPTCTENGSRVGNCQYCGQKVELPIEKTGHNYSGAVTQMYESGLEKTTKDYKHSVACVNDGSHTKEVQCTFVRATELDVPATETTEGKEYERCSVCGGTRYTVTEKLAPEIKYNVVDRNDATTDTSSKVNVVTDKNEENNTVVKAEIKAEEAAKGTKFIGWYDKTGKLVSSSPEFVVTDPSMELTVKTADRANDGYSLGMNGKVDCHVYIDALYYTDNVDNTTITVRYNKNGTTYAQDFVTVTKTGAEVINNGDEFLFTTGYAPAQISEKVTVTISAPDMEAPKVIEASIESYCAAVIGGSYSTELTNLCQSVINYGSAAQDYFDGVTSPDVTTPTTTVENLTTAEVEAYKPTIKQTSASKADFQVTDMTFMSLDNSAIRFYYTGSLDGYTVTADGAVVTPQSKVVDGKTYNYFEVSGIAAADLDVFHDIIIKKDGKIAFYAKASALSYVYLGVNNAPGALQNYKTFLATLVDYNIKNKEYKASQKA